MFHESRPVRPFGTPSVRKRRRPKTAARSSLACARSRNMARLSCRHVTASWFVAAHICPHWPGSLAVKLLLPARARCLPGFLAANLLLPAIARYFPAFLPPGHGFPAHNGPLLPTICPRLLMMARYCSLKILPGASLRAPSVILGRPHDKRRSPRSSRRPPDCFLCGERPRNPCRERGTFPIMLTTRGDYFAPRRDGRIIESYPRSCEPRRTRPR